MCGIAGFLTRGAGGADGDLAATVDAMAATLRHRGPDDAGTWVDEAAGVALGHTRLSIIDLSPAGRQPMVSASGRWVVVFNGEVYNHVELRRELERAGTRFRGTSDTEVLVEALDRWGLDATLRRLNAMFAFAAWDTARRTLSLARDRMGEKPLYYGRVGPGGRTFVFGSELKALRAHPDCTPAVDRGATASFLRYGYVPAPASIYEGIAKLPPACVVDVAVDGDGRVAATGAVRRYWTLPAPVDGYATDDREVVDALEDLLVDSVQLRMGSDVPLGAFLSGGIDSSTVVALMQRTSSVPVQTFTVGFAEQAFDEAPFARRVAEHLGTDHTEVYVSPVEARSVVPRLPTTYDEPFADSSQIPTSIVAEVARRSVTVALSGDGGDELFGGYDRYLVHGGAWAKASLVPRGLRATLRRAGGRGPAFLPYPLRGATLGEKLRKVASVLGAEHPAAMHDYLLSQWQRPHALVLGAPTGGVSLPGDAPGLRGLPFPELMMALDQGRYLPDDILTKVDRATMAVGLEARVPMLDHRVVELAAGLPRRARIRDGVGKWALREVLHRHLPSEVLDRPKQGFAVPIGAWIRGPLRDWAEELLAVGRLESDALLDPAPIRAAWSAHLDGRRDHAAGLWTVLMLQAWLDQDRERHRPAAATGRRR